jgi:hypothetical protein
MSGGQTFSEERLRRFADLAWERGGPMPSEKLGIILWLSDLDGFRLHGRSITGATWVKSPSWLQTVYVREVGPRWFRRYVLGRCGLLAEGVGWLLTAWAVARTVR